MRLLLVEDDAMIGAAAQQGLRQEGHAVDWVRDGRAAELAIANGVYDLLLLDLGLPRRDGLAVLRELRARGSDLGVLVITARDAVADRIAGLDAGADDYLVKPFDLDELAARVRAVLRRRAGRAQSLLRAGALEIDTRARRVRWKGREVGLSAREYALLEALADRPGAFLSRAQLEERLYGWQEEIGSNAVEVHIHALRRKLDPALIRNVRGMGYTLEAGP
jgi:two-component system response regulator QseB